jgi:hypothetical protein
VESMRASMSSIAFWIFFFHCGGMILRTRARLSEVRNLMRHPLHELRKARGL